MKNKKTAILLATYNSEKYIGAQIDSLLQQTYKDWILYVRDDCSTDKTPDILRKYKNLYPNKIMILDNYGQSLKAYRNFVDLLQRVESDYYLFCDHDDVWLPNKVEISINRIIELERQYTSKPIIVHTDMKVVDQNLNVICNSFWKFSNLLPDNSTFEEMVLCNSANGCAMAFNNQAKKVSLPNVEYATMHDMLLNQSVSAQDGIILAIHTPTVLYRQHANNVVGACRRNFWFYVKKMMSPLQILQDNLKCWRLANGIKNISIFSFCLTKIKVQYLKRKVKYDEYE